VTWGYRFLGWEDVGGHHCLKVQFDEVYGLPDGIAERPTVRYWIDLERGGHPLKVEFRRGDKIRMRTAKIELEQVTGSDGRDYWFPVRGVTYVYPALVSGYVDRPVAYEVYKVLDGTVRFNQNLPDSFFTLDWKGAVPENRQLATRRKEFRKPIRRSDPEGIKRQLENDLASANQQSEELEASSQARARWSWSALAQVTFASVGVVFLMAVGIWRWRRK
jgi:hypothetical protein